MSLFGKRAQAKLLFLTLLLLESCKPACTNTNHSKSSDENDIAAIVDGINISKSELDALHKRAIEQFGKTNRPVTKDLEDKLRGSILRKMIDDIIIKQKAEQEGVKVDRIERVEALEKYKDKIGGPKAFEFFLTRQHLTEEQIIKTIEADLQRTKLIEKLASISEPTEAEIKKHYLATQKLYTVPDMVRVRHILLKLSPDEPKEKVDLVLKKAQQILKEASAPQASFEKLVQKYSEGPSVKNGGDLGFFSRGRMVKAFEDAAFNAPLKKPVGPIRTEFGYHIIYVEEKTPTKISSLDEVRSRVIEYLKQNKRSLKSEELLSSLRKTAKVTIKDHSLTDEQYNELAERDEIIQPKKQEKAVP